MTVAWAQISHPESCSTVQHPPRFFSNSLLYYPSWAYLRLGNNLFLGAVRLSQPTFCLLLSYWVVFSNTATISSISEISPFPSFLLTKPVVLSWVQLFPAVTSWCIWKQSKPTTNALCQALCAELQVHSIGIVFQVSTEKSIAYYFAILYVDHYLFGLIVYLPLLSTLKLN